MSRGCGFALGFQCKPTAEARSEPRAKAGSHPNYKLDAPSFLAKSIKVLSTFMSSVFM